MELPAENKHYTFADCLSWPENTRCELINGAAVMLAMPPRVHQAVVMELFRQLANFLEGKRCEVYLAPFAVRLFEKDNDSSSEVDTMVEPDISVICDPNKLDRYGCKGAPDLIVEVLSLSTQRHDRLIKWGLYQKAGVREYWLVDPDHQIVQVNLLRDGRYEPFEVYTAEAVAKVNLLDGCFVELSKVFKN